MIDKLFNIDSFIERISKEINDYDVFHSLEEILLNSYFVENNTSGHLKENFIKAYSKEAVSHIQLKEIIKTDDFKQWATCNFRKEISLFLKKLSIENDEIILYRAINTNFDWIKETLSIVDDSVRIGIYWTYRYDKAISYCGNKKPKYQYICKGNFSLKNIDWYKTFLFNISNFQKEECEIRVFKNRKIKKFSVEKIGDFFTYSFKENKIFKS